MKLLSMFVNNLACLPLVCGDCDIVYGLLATCCLVLCCLPNSLLYCCEGQSSESAISNTLPLLFFTCKTGHVSQNLKALLNRLASHCFNGWEQEMNNEINIDDQYFHWISTWKDIGTKPAASAKENKIKGWKTQQVHNRHRKFYFLIDEKLFCQPPFIYNTLKS